MPRLTAATFASGTAAFDGSLTGPVMEAFVVCARSAQGYQDKQRASRRRGTLGTLDIRLPGAERLAVILPVQSRFCNNGV